jgi:peptidoglycan/LPS O-acetylase OafA/YrhL
MTLTRILPAIMMVLSLAAAAIYFFTGDWRRGGYWLAAAAITFFVTV